MAERVVKNPAEYEDLIPDILKKLPMGDRAVTITLQGDLGAGKTTFTQALAKHLGVEERVPSPTFVIMRRYETANETYPTFVHIDAYRIEDENELAVLHIPELLATSGTLTVIEWPERVPGIVPKDAYSITFAINDDDSRTVTYDS